MFIAPSEVQKPRYFGGVVFWSDVITEIIDNRHEFESGMLLDYPFRIPFFAFIAVDIPLSAAADTLTLPIVAIERGYWKNISTFDPDLSVAEDSP